MKKLVWFLRLGGVDKREKKEGKNSDLNKMYEIKYFYFCICMVFV